MSTERLQWWLELINQLIKIVINQENLLDRLNLGAAANTFICVSVIGTMSSGGQWIIEQILLSTIEEVFTNGGNFNRKST